VTLEGDVNSSDLSVLLSNWAKPGPWAWTDGNFNGDGSINSSDLSLLLSHWAK
jgi:hypothetical protein